MLAAQLRPAPYLIHPKVCIPRRPLPPTAKLGTDVSIQPHAVIEDGVIIGDRTIIGAGSYVGHESRVGADCLLYARISLRERTILGDRVILHCGVVLGADGFGFDSIGGKPRKIPKIGHV